MPYDLESLLIRFTLKTQKQLLDQILRGQYLLQHYLQQPKSRNNSCPSMGTQNVAYTANGILAMKGELRYRL